MYLLHIYIFCYPFKKNFKIKSRYPQLRLNNIKSVARPTTIEPLESLIKEIPSVDHKF